MLGAATKVAGVAGSRMSSSVGKVARHIKKAASSHGATNVLDPAVVRENVSAMASGKMSNLDPDFKRAVNRWRYSSDASHLGDDLDIIRQATRESHLSSGKPLYRGVRHSSAVQEESILAGGSDVVDWDALQVGSEFKLGATSWSTSKAVSSSYSDPMGTILEIPEGSKGLKLGAEFVTEGKFRVSSIEPGDLKTPRRVALEKIDEKISGAIVRDENVSAVWEELNSLDMAIPAPRVKAPPPPTADKSMLMQPRHSTARYGIPKRSRG